MKCDEKQNQVLLWHFDCLKVFLWKIRSLIIIVDDFKLWGMNLSIIIIIIITEIFTNETLKQGLRVKTKMLMAKQPSKWNFSLMANNHWKLTL